MKIEVGVVYIESEGPCYNHAYFQPYEVSKDDGGETQLSNHVLF